MLQLRHIREVVGILHDAGIEDVQVEHGRHVHVKWMINGKNVQIICASSPRDPGTCLKSVKSDIRRLFKEHGMQIKIA